MGRRLAGYVPVHGEGGEVTWYGPNDKIPAAVAKNIGDHAWVEVDDDGNVVEPPAEGGPPPLTGRGATDKAWREYAASEDVRQRLEAAGESPIDADAKKDDIVAVLVRAGIVPAE